jgi:L-ascorbate metabolism protein UlaG (beta-lactamase superfamily)
MIVKSGKELAAEISATATPNGSFAFWWLGQLGYAIKLGEAVIYIDAYLSPGKARQVPPLLSPGDMTNAALILGTHDHGDHIDRRMWPELAQAATEAAFVVPAPFAKGLGEALGVAPERMLAARENEPIEAAGVKVTPIAAAHELPEYIDGDSAFLSYVIEGNGCKILHTGDACIYEGYLTKLKKLGKLSAVFLPINGRDAIRLRSNCIGNMTYQEAVDLVGALEPGLAVPGHYEMFAHNSENPELFRDYLDAKYPALECWIGDHGSRVCYS